MPDLQQLDFLVAEHIFGDVKDANIKYSSEISSAWTIVEKLELTVGPTVFGGWYAKNDVPLVICRAKTAPLAICLAALGVKGIFFNQNLAEHP